MTFETYFVTLLGVCFLRNCLVHKDIQFFMMLFETALLLFLSWFIPNEKLTILVYLTQGTIWLYYLLGASPKKRSEDDIKLPLPFLTPYFLSQNDG